jgi:hypothetical protein
MSSTDNEPKTTESPSYIIFKLLVYLTEIAFFLKNLTDSFNFILVLKFPQCERSEPLFPNNLLLNFEEVCKNCT